MDFSWLGNIFGDLMKVFRPLAAIKHWRIWAALWDVILRLRTWYRWYQANVQKRLRAVRALYNQLFNQFVAPILRIVDTIRRLTGIVGLVNHKLAAKLNTIFLRVEGYLLAPFNAVIRRINTMERMFSGFLTPLGYLDRFTLLNSLWRDIGYLRTLLRDPLGQRIAPAPTPPLGDFDTSLLSVTNSLQGIDSPIAADVDASVTIVRGFLGV